MMDRKPKYFTLSLESLRAVGGWAADCAERALPVYETHADSDARPRAAIEGIRVFAAGGRRTAQLRSLALAALAAAREVDDPAAAAAARAAGLAASSAYTHPLANVQQTKHIVGPAAYAALALELAHAGDPRVGDAVVRWAIEHAPSEVCAVLLQIPARQAGKSRLDTLLYALDAGIRGRILPQDANPSEDEEVSMGPFARKATRKSAKSGAVTGKTSRGSTGEKRAAMKGSTSPSPKEQSASQQIDAIIKEPGDWRGKRLSRLRALIKQADPAVLEEVKWKKPSRPTGVPVWFHAGILCVADTLKHAVRLTFPKGAQLKDPQKLFNTRLDSKTVRAIDFHEDDPVDEAALMALIRAAVRVNMQKRQ
jgi:hypothetical protein